MRTLKTILITIVLALLAGIAYVYSGFHDVSATTRHNRFASWGLSMTVDKSVARRAKEVAVPDLDDETLRLTGINDYEAMCVDCHGAPGKDAAAVGEGLNPSPPDLAHSAQELSAAELFWVTKHGIRMTGMPAWGRTHDDKDLWPVVAFMQALPKLDEKAYRSMLAKAEGLGHHPPQDDAGTDDHAHGDHDHSHDH